MLEYIVSLPRDYSHRAFGVRVPEHFPYPHSGNRESQRLKLHVVIEMFQE